MSLLAVGINHTTAPVQLRELAAIGPDATNGALKALTAEPGIDAAAIVSTCNRTEIYCHAQEDGMGLPLHWLHRFNDITSGTLEQYAYTHVDRDAVRHLLRVATGLDSMVVGEPQILGQIKAAYQAARQAETMGPALERLFQHSFAVAKRVRTQTKIGANPISVAYAAVTMAKRIFGNLSTGSIILIGAGETIELVARHFRRQGAQRIIVANRTLSRAQDLADTINGDAIVLEHVDRFLPSTDIIVSSTASPDRVLDAGDLKAAMKERRRRPLLIVDLAVPLDVDPKAGDLSDVYLYNVDDLKGVVAAGMQQRKLAARQAESMIDLEADQFMVWVRSLEGLGTLRNVRQQADEIRSTIVEESLRQLEAGQTPADVVRRQAHQLTNLLLHNPTQALRKAAEHGEDDILRSAETLFNLRGDDSES